MTTCGTSHVTCVEYNHVVSKETRLSLLMLSFEVHSIDSHMSKQRLLFCINLILLRSGSVHDGIAFSVQGVVTVGDYDGVVSQIHLESGHFIADLDDHGGQR